MLVGMVLLSTLGGMVLLLTLGVLVLKMPDSAALQPLTGKIYTHFKAKVCDSHWSFGAEKS